MGILINRDQWDGEFKRRMDWLKANGCVMHQNNDETYSAWLILRELQPAIFLEIGSLAGGTLYVYASACDVAATIISLDQSRTPQYAGRLGIVVAQLQREGYDVERITDSSLDAKRFAQCRKLWPQIDALHIDGDHRYASVRSDYDTYGSLVRSGGVILLHDAVAAIGVNKLWGELECGGEATELLAFGVQGEELGGQPAKAIHANNQIIKGIGVVRRP